MASCEGLEAPLFVLSPKIGILKQILFSYTIRRTLPSSVGTIIQVNSAFLSSGAENCSIHFGEKLASRFWHTFWGSGSSLIQRGRIAAILGLAGGWSQLVAS